MIEVLIADDQGMMRTLLTGICNAAEDMTVVGEAKTGEAAIQLAQATRPDIALVDIKMPGISGLEVTRRLARQLPQTQVIVLTALDGHGFAARAMAAGAQGFLTKQAVVHELLRTIRKVHGGGCYLDSGVAQRIASGALTSRRGACRPAFRPGSGCVAADAAWHDRGRDLGHTGACE